MANISCSAYFWCVSYSRFTSISYVFAFRAVHVVCQKQNGYMYKGTGRHSGASVCTLQTGDNAMQKLNNFRHTESANTNFVGFFDVLEYVMFTAREHKCHDQMFCGFCVSKVNDVIIFKFRRHLKYSKCAVKTVIIPLICSIMFTPSSHSLICMVRLLTLFRRRTVFCV